MVKRICDIPHRKCPNCGVEWYSHADAESVWICDNCGAEIPMPDEAGVV